MITKQLFRRAATLAAEGKFSEQESAAVLRHILLYDYRPSVFDALLILSPITEPAIILRFLKAYRHQDILYGLALLKECGRGDLADIDIAMLTMYPERALPMPPASALEEATGVPLSAHSHKRGEDSAAAEADAGADDAAGYDGVLSSLEDRIVKAAASRAGSARSLKTLASASSNAHLGLGNLAGCYTQQSHFPHSAMTIGELQGIVARNHSNQKSSADLLEETEDRSRRIAAMEALGYTDDRIAAELRQGVVDQGGRLADDELDRLIGGDFEGRTHQIEGLSRSAAGGPVILDVDKKWSGLMAAAAEEDGLRPSADAMEDEFSNYGFGNSLPGASSGSASDAAAGGSMRSHALRQSLEGLSPAEAAVVEEELKAVEAFERAQQQQNNAGGWGGVGNSSTDGTGVGGFSASHEGGGWGSSQDSDGTSASAVSGGGWGGLTTAESEEGAMLKAAAEVEDAVTSVFSSNSDAAPAPNTTAPNHAEGVNAAEGSSDVGAAGSTDLSSVFLPTCPPLAPTPLSDFDAFFRTRLMVAAEKVVRQSRKNIIGHERFFLLAKSFAQMQSINPQAMKLIVDRGMEILTIVFEGRDRLWTAAKDTRGKGRYSGKRRMKPAKRSGSPAKGKAVANDATAQKALAAGEGSAAAASALDENGLPIEAPATPPPTKTKEQLEDEEAARLDASSVPSPLLSAVLDTLNPNAVALTPSYVVSVAASALDFFSIALTSSAVPSYSPKLTQRRSEAAILRPVKYGQKIAEAAELEASAKDKGHEGSGGDASMATPTPTLPTSANGEDYSDAIPVDSISILAALHQGVHDTSLAVITMKDHATIGDVAKALRAHVGLIKTGFAIERTIPIAHTLIALAQAHLDASLGEASSADLDKYIGLVPPVRALCASNRFPDARILRVKLATILQHHIFDSDDETFYRYCGIAITPESGVYGLTAFTGDQRLRMSRILAFADSAYHRPIPSQPRRLASACELLRSVNRRRFGMARYAIFTASKSPPRTLREYVDVGRMMQYASIHPEIYNRSHGGYAKLVHFHCNLMGVTNSRDIDVAEELCGLTRSHHSAGPSVSATAVRTAEGTDERGHSKYLPHVNTMYGVVSPMGAKDILALEQGRVTEQRRTGKSVSKDLTRDDVDMETALNDEEEGAAADGASGKKKGGITTGVVVINGSDESNIKAAGAADGEGMGDSLRYGSLPGEDAAVGEEASRRNKFALRLIQNVGPYRKGVLSSFANEPFVLNWFIANQREIFFNTLIVTLRVLASSDEFLLAQLKQDATNLAVQQNVARRRLDGEEDKRNGGGSGGSAQQGGGGGEEGQLPADKGLSSSSSRRHQSSSTTVAVCDKYGPQYQQLITFILSVIRFRLATLHAMAFRPSHRIASSKGTDSLTNNPREFTVRHRVAANIFKIVSEEVLGIIPLFTELPETAKVHSKSIMSLAQRTNTSGYGALIIEHGRGFSRAIHQGDGEGTASSSNGGKKGSSSSPSSLATRMHMAVNFNQLLAPKSLSHSYSVPQMIRLMGLLHDYHVTFRDAAKQSNGASDPGRTVLPAHWDALLKGLRYRVLNDEGQFERSHVHAFLQVLSRIVHDTLATEEDALHSFKAAEMLRLKKEGTLSDEEIRQRVRSIVLPASMLDVGNKKAVEAAVVMLRWMCVVPPEEQAIFGAEHVAHLLKLLALPEAGKRFAFKRAASGHLKPAIDSTEGFNAAAERVMVGSSSHAATAAEDGAGALDMGLSEQRSAGPTVSTIAHRINLARHFPPSALHASRVKGTLLPNDLVLELAQQAAYNMHSRPDFDARIAAYLTDVFEGKHGEAFATIKKAFAANCHKPAGLWDSSLKARAALRAKQQKRGVDADANDGAPVGDANKRRRGDGRARGQRSTAGALESNQQFKGNVRRRWMGKAHRRGVDARLAAGANDNSTNRSAANRPNAHAEERK